jgi:disulfide bond formation protein DsbB
MLKEVRWLFGAYQICLYCRLASFGLVAVGVIAAIMLRDWAILYALVAASLVSSLLSMVAACPSCGKHPASWAIYDSEPLWLQFLQLGRGRWPERICSRCGTDLDVAPCDRS